jgi:hypothetical protein
MEVIVQVYFQYYEYRPERKVAYALKHLIILNNKSLDASTKQNQK